MMYGAADETRRPTGDDAVDEALRKLDAVTDRINSRFGKRAIRRGGA